MKKSKTRFKTIFFFWAFLFSVMMPVQAYTLNSANFTGAGTSGDPYLIKDVLNLARLAHLVNTGVGPYATAHFRLENDIDLNVHPWNTGNGWLPIGDNRTNNINSRFRGVFDGNGKTISNLFINRNEHHLGLFGFIAAGGTVKNLGIVNARVNSTGAANRRIGVLAGEMTGAAGAANIAQIRNVFTIGIITSSSRSDAAEIGGLVGLVENNARIDSSWSMVTIDAPYASRVGGLVGHAEHSAAVLMHNVALNNSIRANLTANTFRVGSINPAPVAARFANHALRTMVSPGAGVFGVERGLYSRNGLDFPAITTHAHSLTEESVILRVIHPAIAAFASVRWFRHDGANYILLGTADTLVVNANQAGMFMAAVTLSDTANNPRFQAAEFESVRTTVVAFQQFGGAGTANNPYRIYTAQQLAGLATLINQNYLGYFTASGIATGYAMPGAHFRLERDIDLSVFGANNPDFNEGNGWIPIGSNVTDNSASVNSRFRGVFDGNGRTISNLYINRSGTHIGLFGFITAVGTVAPGSAVRNLRIVDADINTNLAADHIIGVLAGQVIGVNATILATVENVFTTGTITSVANGANRDVGGIIGLVANNTRLFNSWSNVTINAFNAQQVGGLVGRAPNAADWIHNSVALNDTIIGNPATNRVFGSGNITNRLNNHANREMVAGRVPFTADRAHNHAGGLDFPAITPANANLPSLIANGRLSLQVVIPPAIATFVNTIRWYRDGQHIPNQSGFTLTIPSSGGYYHAVITMRDTITNRSLAFPDMTFSTVRTFVAPTANTLAVRNPNPLVARGTATNPFLIRSVEDLATLATLVNANRAPYATRGTHFSLENDIDFNHPDAAIWSTGAWIPIGNSKQGVNSHFRGVFNGNGRTISNFYINREGWNIGLFGVIGEGGIVRNLRILDADINTTDATDRFIGVLAGQAIGVNATTHAVRIENVFTTGTIRSAATFTTPTPAISPNGGDIGGIIGGLTGNTRLINSWSNVTIDAFDATRVGGLVGTAAAASDSIVRSVALNDMITGNALVNRVFGNPAAIVAQRVNNHGLRTMMAGRMPFNAYRIHNQGSGLDFPIITRHVEANRATLLEVVIPSAIERFTTIRWYRDDGFVGTGNTFRPTGANTSGVFFARVTIADTARSGNPAFETMVFTTPEMSIVAIPTFAGSGTAGAPFLIANEAQLAGLAALVNANVSPYADEGMYFRLMADLNLGEWPWSVGSGWIPIGGFDNPFRGVFDGNGRTISNMFINNGGSNIGLFGNIVGGHVKNLGVVNANINATDVSGRWVGVLAGNIQGTVSATAGRMAIVENSFTTGYIFSLATAGNIPVTADAAATAVGAAVSADIGGVVGRANGLQTRVENNWSTVTIEAASAGNIGGIIGRYATASDTVRRSVALNPSLRARAPAQRIVGQAGTVVAYQRAENRAWWMMSALGYGAIGTARGLNNHNNGLDFPTIIPPLNTTLLYGDTLRLEVYIPSAILPFARLQWYRDGTRLDGETSDTLQRNNISIEDAGYYSVVVTVRDPVTGRHGDFGIFTSPEMGITIIQKFFHYGDGTARYPFLIKTPRDLANLATAVNTNHRFYAVPGVHFKLVNNLDLSVFGPDSFNFNAGNGWIPIGDNRTNNINSRFRGVFDGNFHTISNLYINRQGNFTGLFGHIHHDSAVVKNLGVVNVDITSTSTAVGINVNAGVGVGGLVGILYRGQITNSFTTGRVVSTSPQAQNLGGIAGVVTITAAAGINPPPVGASSLTNSWSAVSIAAPYNYAWTHADAGSIGGIVGRINHANSRVTGNVFLGEGLKGMRSDANGLLRVARIVGLAGSQATTISNNHAWAGTHTGGGVHFATAATAILSAMQVGANLRSGANLTFDDIRDGTIGGRFTEADGWAVRQGYLPGFGQPIPMPAHIRSFSGSGTATDPFEIRTVEDLALMAAFVNSIAGNYRTAHYRLMSDLDLGVAPWNTGRGWTPIGYIAPAAFQGVFDGNHHTISNLYINRVVNFTATTYGTGLFGRVERANAAIRNLAVVDADVRSTGSRIGVLVGYLHNGLVENVYTTGYLTGTGTEVNIIGFGGIIGRIFHGQLNRSWSTVIVDATTASFGRVGGLVGCLGLPPGAVTNSVALNYIVSGLASTGRVIGNTAGASRMTDNFAWERMRTGGGVAFPAAVGSNQRNGGDITNRQINSRATSGNINEMFAGHGWATKQDHLPGFGQPIEMPEHLIFYGYFCGGDGSPGNPYQICYVEDLERLARLVNDDFVRYRRAHYRLMNDIDLTEFLRENPQGWRPIGDNTREGAYFEGTFSGGGHTISGLRINQTGNNKGLFGVIAGNAVVDSLGLDININSNGSRIGGIAGTLQSGTIRNSFTTGNITCSFAGASEGLGGIVGYSAGNVTNNWSTVDIASHSATNSMAGGIVGRVSGGTTTGNLALGPNIRATGDVGRVVANATSASVNGNYAYFRMTAQGGIPFSGNENRDGTDFPIITENSPTNLRAGDTLRLSVHKPDALALAIIKWKFNGNPITDGTSLERIVRNDDFGAYKAVITVDEFTFETMPTTVTVEARYYPITYNNRPANGRLTVMEGTSLISDRDSVPWGTMLTIIVEPNANHYLDSLFINNSLVPHELIEYNTTTHFVDSNTHIRAVFAPDTFPVIADVIGYGALTVMRADGTEVVNGQSVPLGTRLEITARAGNNYHVDSILVNGIVQFVRGNAQIDSVTRSHTVGDTTIIRIVFTKNTFPITFNNPANGELRVTAPDIGALNSGDRIAWGTQLTITATPNSRYHLDSLSVDGMDVRSIHNTILIGFNHTIEAETRIFTSFTRDSFPVQFTPRPANGIVRVTFAGTTDTLIPNQRVPWGTILTITATPNDNYHVSVLTVNGSNLPPGNTHTIVVDTATATTAINVAFAINRFAVNHSTTGGGVVSVTHNGNSIGNDVPWGTPLAITATPNTGYQLVALVVNATPSDVQPAGVTIIDTVTSTTHIVANFIREGYYGVTFFVLPHDGAGEATSEHGHYQEGTTVRITATANTANRYEFVEWLYGGEHFSDDAEYTFSMPDSNKLLVAVFARERFPVTFDENSAGGRLIVLDGTDTVHSGDRVAHNSELTIIAIPNPCFHLDSFSANNTVFDISANGATHITGHRGTYTVLGATNIFASFAIDSFAVHFPRTITGGTLRIEKEGNIWVDSGQNVACGTVLTISAIPHPQFEGGILTVNGVNFTSGNPHTILGTTTIYATFERNAFPVYFVDYPPENGTLTVMLGDRRIHHGDHVAQGLLLTITAEPNDCYRLDTLTVNNLPTVNSHRVAGRTYIRATFAKDSFEIIRNVPENGTLIVEIITESNVPNDTIENTGRRVQCDTRLIITAIPDTGYILVALSVNAAQHISGREHEVTSTTNIFASFVPAGRFQISLLHSPPSAGTTEIKYTTGDTAFLVNDTVTIVATPNDHYHFVRWIDGETTFSEDSMHGFRMENRHKILMAEFARNRYPVTFSSTGNGELIVAARGERIESGDFVSHGTALTITAIPNEGHHTSSFSFSVDGNSVVVSGNDTTIFVEGTTTISAVFAPNMFAVTREIIGDGTLTVTRADNGATINNQPIPWGTRLVITATPGANYRLATLAVNAAQFRSGDTLTVTSTTNILAKFMEEGRFSVTLLVSPHDAAGNVTGGRFDLFEGDGVTIRATANQHYRFVEWRDARADTLFSENPTHNFAMPYSHLVLAAVFARDRYPVTFNQPANGTLVVMAGMDTIRNGDHVPHGTVLTITAIPAEGHHINSLSVNNTDFASGQNHTIEGITTIFAAFAIDMFAVIWAVPPGGTLRVERMNGTSVTNGQHVPWETELRIIATPSTNHILVALAVNSVQYDVSLEQNRSDTIYISVISTTNILARFVEQGRFAVTLLPSPLSGGTVSGYGDFHQNNRVHIEAIHSPHYHFVRWLDGTDTISTAAQYDFLMPNRHRVLTAVFARNLYPVHFNNIDGNGEIIVTAGGVRIQSGDLIPHGTLLTITAMPANGYHATALSINGTTSTNGTRTHEVVDTTTISATFTRIPLTVTFDGNPANGRLTVMNGIFPVGSGESVPWGTNLTITAIPDSGYRLAVLAVNSVQFTSGDTLNVTNHVNILVSFAPANRFGLTLRVSPDIGAGTVRMVRAIGDTITTGNATFLENAPITIIATSTNHYDFMGWYDGETVFSRNAEYTFSMPDRHKVLTAEFSRITHPVRLNNPDNGNLIVTTGIDTIASSLTTLETGVPRGTQLTITAVPDAGHHIHTFTVSQNGNNSVIDGQRHFHSVYGITNVFASFARDTFPVNKIVAAEEGKLTVRKNGDISLDNGDFVPWGTELTITAEPKRGFDLMALLVNGVPFEGQPHIVSGETNIHAIFRPSDRFTVTYRVMPYFDAGEVNIAGEVESETTFLENDSITITAIPEEHYRFVEWLGNGGSHITTDSAHGFRMPSSPQFFTAIFERNQHLVRFNDPDHGRISVSNSATGFGISDSSYISEGTVLTIRTVPDPGFRLGILTETGVELPVTPIPGGYEITLDPINSAINIFVLFISLATEETFDVTLSASPDTVGTVSGGGRHLVGSPQTITATLTHNRYHFVEWREYNRGTHSTDSMHTFYMPGRPLNLTAVFARDQYPVAIFSPENGMLTVVKTDDKADTIRSGRFVPWGTQLTIIATPDENHHIRAFTINGIPKNGRYEYTYTVDSATLIYVDFLPTGGTGIAIPEQDVGLIVFPNPVTDELRIENGEWRIGDIIEIFDMNGNRVFSQKVNHSQFSILNSQFIIDMSPFPPGTYILRIGNHIARIVVR